MVAGHRMTSGYSVYMIKKQHLTFTCVQITYYFSTHGTTLAFAVFPLVPGCALLELSPFFFAKKSILFQCHVTLTTSLASLCLDFRAIKQPPIGNETYIKWISWVKHFCHHNEWFHEDGGRQSESKEKVCPYS